MRGDAEARVRAEQELSKLRVIWFAFLFAHVVYGAIVYFVRPVGTSLDPELLQWIAIFAGVMAGIDLLVVFVLKQMIAGVTGSNYTTFVIVRYAMVEAIGVFGLAQHFLGAEWPVPVVFLALSFSMLMTMQPSALEAADLQKNWR